ncbi:collagenase [Streptomyces sp. NBC_01264]|uniref:collagenase n=1 Tax=Streptomyces sp. NBC_01264 TaxID=2903804 RepID=UPI0022518DD0|nr:collagenase [Streptomyces sp. NBC_01264]MCX4781996.1 collagenase [Streptomyces sp. NBC_01264]
MRSSPTTKGRARPLIAALACCLGVTLLAPAGQAFARDPKPAAPAPALRAGAAPQPSTPAAAAASLRAEHAARPDADLSERAPLRATKDAARTEQKASKATLAPGAAAAAEAAAACNVADFTSKTGAALVQQIKASEMDCVNSLFLLKGNDAQAAFREAQMVSVADALRTVSATYPGDNSTKTGQLVLFLRAGYYVQWYNESTVGTYGPALKSSIRGALDTFFAAPRAADVTEANGSTLAESVILIDSAQENARYLGVAKRMLTGYNSSYNSSSSMVAAVNNAYTVLFRGHQTPEFLPAVQADPSILTVLRDFAVTHDALLGTDKSYLTANAGRELGRFLQHSALQATVRPLVKQLLDRTSITGRTASLWVPLAEMTASYDAANCSSYGTCDLPARVRAAVLTVNHTCSPSLRIVAQQMTAAELGASCTSLANQDAFFHNVVKDGGPVANDRNTALEVVAFDSSADYQAYAGVIFGISTDNGGMYLEGDPSATGNQPRFIAYEAEWVRPEFQIWNLNHEYTHYLDGRFNMFGDFDEGMTTPTVMWVEGFAEYISYSYRGVTYDRAVTEAGKNTYKLSTLVDTTYDNSDSTRVYQWGYLAVRYLLQSHPQDVATLLGHYRAGNWAAARTLLTSTIGTRYDADFAAWLVKCAAGDCGGATTPPVNQAPVAGFSAAVNALAVSFTDSSTDADGTIASRAWNFGDGTTSTSANPAKTYAAAGTYTVRLTVTDNKGATATTTKAVTVGSAGTGECTNPDVRVLGDNCRRSNVSATTGNYGYFYLDVPAGTGSLKISVSGGTGNADLYYSPTTWATTGNHTARSAQSGNSESLTINNPAAGRVYISLHAVQGFAGVTVSTQFGTAQVECPGTDVRVLGADCSRSNVSATAGNYRYFYVNVPAGTGSLKISVSGGTGNADLYYSPTTWATTGNHTARSAQSGNTETLTVNNPPAGYLYVSLHAAQDFAGATVSSRF